MIPRTFILAAFILALLSCNSNSSTSRAVKSGGTATYPPGSDIQPNPQANTIQQHANIVRIIEKVDTTFLDVDYIQYLTGEAAIEAAKKAHQADTFQTEDGNTHIDVANDYFIVNESKETKRLPLAKDCIFELIINRDRRPIADNSLKSLRAIYTDRPFILTLNENGVVVKVQEVFLP